MAENRHPLAAVVGNDLFERFDHGAAKRRNVHVRAVAAGDERLPGFIVLGLELFHWHVSVGFAVVLRYTVVNANVLTGECRIRPGGFHGALHRAGIDRMDGLVGQPACCLVRLFPASRCKRRVSFSMVEFDPFGQTVSHQNQFHLSRSRQSPHHSTGPFSTPRGGWGSVPGMNNDLLEWARDLAPRIDALAAEIEAQRRLPEALLEELFAQDIFRALVPRALGGQERELPEFMAAVEQLARADASTAWCVNQAGVFATMSAWFEPEGAAEIWADEHCAIGNGPPPLGTATVIDGGFEVTGRWSFSSGCDHATWLSGIARVHNAEARMFFFPRAEVNFHDTWDVRGLRGTGSHDFSVDARFVPMRRSVKVPTGAVPTAAGQRPGPLFVVPTVLLFACGFAAVAVGVARGALDDALALARAKTARFSRTALKADPHVLEQVGRAETVLRGARHYLFGTVAEVWVEVLRSGSIGLQQRILLRMAATHCIRESARVVDIAYNVAGTDAIHEAQSLQRRFQDMHVITQHVQARTAFYAGLGGYFLNGDWPDSPYI